MPKLNFKCAKCGILLQGDVKLRDSIRCPECKSDLVITKVPSIKLTTRIKDILQSPSSSENVFVVLFLLGFALLLFAGYKASKEHAAV